MVGKERALEAIEKVIKLSPGDQTEVVVSGSDSYLTRIAENQIHQNVGEKNSGLTVKVIIGKKIGTASTNSLTDNAIKSVVEQATAIARLQRDNPEFVSLPQPRPLPQVDTFVAATADASPQERADKAGALIAEAKRQGQRAAGAVSTTAREAAIGNSLGVRAYNRSTAAALSTVFMSDTSSGYAAATSRNFADIDAIAAGRVAGAKCRDSVQTDAVEAGEYEVILEPAAVADMLSYLMRFGFSGLMMHEGRSFMTEQTLGTKIVSDKVTIWDDGLDPAGMATPFDAEGMPKQRLMLVEAGVARNVCYDTFTAHKFGKQSTGHAIGFMGFGGIPTNVFMEPGDASLDDMVRATKRGIYVTRFHYTNAVHPIRTLFTGMTRDGTFLVEDGKIVKAVKNFRFTESVLRAFSGVEMVGRDTKMVGSYFGGARVPALKISKFAFTGTTEF